MVNGLAQFVVACEIGILKPDVKEFGHGLRGFAATFTRTHRMVSGFTLTTTCHARSCPEGRPQPGVAEER